MGQPTTAILADLAGPGLAPGEQVRAGARCTYQGTSATSRLSITAELASMDAAIGAGTREGEEGAIDPDTLVVFPTASQMAILVTDARLIGWGLSLTGKPQQVLGSVRAGAMASVRHGEIRPTLRIRVGMKSGTEIDIETRKGEDVQAFVDALHALVPGGSADA